MATKSTLAPPLLLAFPRSMSSFTSFLTGQMLKADYQYPKRRSGELLHYELLGNQWTRSYELDRSKMKPFLDVLQQASVKKMIVKDVHQPFVCQTFLNENPTAFNPIYIHRSLADILYRCAMVGWFWPMLYKDDSDIQYVYERSNLEWKRKKFLTDFHFANTIRYMADGLVYVQETIYKHIPQRLDFEILIRDEQYLFQQLSEFGYRPERVSYIDQQFKKDRNRVLSYRQEPFWHVCRGVIKVARENYNALCI